MFINCITQEVLLDEIGKNNNALLERLRLLALKMMHRSSPLENLKIVGSQLDCPIDLLKAVF